MKDHHAQICLCFSATSWEIDDVNFLALLGIQILRERHGARYLSDQENDLEESPTQLTTAAERFVCEDECTANISINPDEV